jgi:phosphoribosylglycinamide formyltransferase 1
MAHKLQLGVLASGRGSNLQAILDHCREADYPAQVKVVISDVADAYALQRAKKAGIPAVTLNPRDFPNRQAYDFAVAEALKNHQVELVVMAGYIRIITAPLLEAFANRIINIHPSLIPAFCGKGMHGLKVHQAAIAYGVKLSGLTVHFVEAEIDAGSIILQHCVPVLEADTPESLSERILNFEHKKYPEAIRLLGEGRVIVEGRKVRILPAPSAP